LAARRAPFNTTNSDAEQGAGLALNHDDVLLSEGQLRVRGKGNKLRFLPLAPETTQLLDHYLLLDCFR
jgi:site-specific recombinase XerC